MELLNITLIIGGLVLVTYALILLSKIKESESDEKFR